MEFKDRVANKPNRVKLTYEDSGASAYATVELADEPIENGTPLNRNTFEQMQVDLMSGEEGVFSIEAGGTGAKTADEARSNLGVPKIEYGIDNCLVGANGAAGTTFAFKTKFTSTPTVIVTPNAGMSGGGRDLRVGVVGVTPTQFTISISSVTEGQILVHWIAVGK